MASHHIARSWKVDNPGAGGSDSLGHREAVENVDTEVQHRAV
jgi:hypothetical protein